MKRRYNETWSDDPSNDDWKKNPDGTYMRDEKGNKIPITFADDINELKAKMAKLPAKIKQKIAQFLMGGNDNMMPAYSESTKITLTVGQLRRLVKESTEEPEYSIKNAKRIARKYKSFNEKLTNASDLFIFGNENDATAFADEIDELWDLGSSTGYYDPEEDERDGETNAYTGKWYVDWQ